MDISRRKFITNASKAAYAAPILTTISINPSIAAAGSSLDPSTLGNGNGNNSNNGNGNNGNGNNGNAFGQKDGKGRNG